MKQPRVQFTVRRLMIAVAILAFALAVVIMVNRSRGFRELALENADAE